MPNDDLPGGGIDLHVHTAPDVTPRRIDDRAMAARCAAAGMAGAVLKAHHEPTGGRAWHASRVSPGVAVFGGIVLNRAVGGINADAVEAMARAEGGCGRIVWLPTRDAAHDLRLKGKAGAPVEVLADGRPTAALRAVLQVVAAHDLILASGHVAPDEALVVFGAARRAGCRRMIATHVTARVSDYTAAQMDAAAATGAVLEFCARNLFAADTGGDRRLDPAKAAAAGAAIRRLGAGRCVLSSDLGDPRFPDPVDGLAAAAQALLRAGLDAAELERLLVTGPRRLLGLG